jgi:dynein heavy chain
MHDYPVLFYGKTGTGKTMVVKRFLLNEVDTNAYVPTITAFSANTSCLQVLDVLEQKLEK